MMRRKPISETLAVNDGDTEAYGVEVELTYVPNDNFRVDFNLRTLAQLHFIHAYRGDLSTVGWLTVRDDRTVLSGD